MALTIITMKLIYENENYFKLTSKLNDEGLKIIAYHDENGKVGELWPLIQKQCETYFKEELRDIGNAMKAD